MSYYDRSLLEDPFAWAFGIIALVFVGALVWLALRGDDDPWQCVHKHFAGTRLVPISNGKTTTFVTQSDYRCDAWVATFGDSVVVRHDHRSSVHVETR